MSMDRLQPSAAERRGWAVVGVVLIALAVGLVWAVYARVLTPSMSVTVVADRAGLLLDKGAQVRLSGVAVGRVTGIGRQGDDAVIRLELDPEAVRALPANTTAAIDGTSLFGPKNVALIRPAVAAAQPLRAGARLRATSVTDEVNDVLDKLQGVIAAAPPAQVEQVLANTATALAGRGERIGDLITGLDDYLATLQPHLPKVAKDLSEGSKALAAYADAAPDLLTTLDNLTTTSNTLVDTSTTLHTVLVNYAQLSDDVGDVMSRLRFPLPKALNLLRPVTRLLAEYAPELTCVVQGLNQARIGAEQATAAQVSALQMRVVILPSQQSYEYPRDLPKLIRGVGPHCFQAPLRKSPATPTPRYQFDDGTHVYDSHSDALTIGNPPVALFSQLFGVSAGQAAKLTGGRSR